MFSLRDAYANQGPAEKMAISMHQKDILAQAYTNVNSSLLKNVQFYSQEGKYPVARR